MAAPAPPHLAAGDQRLQRRVRAQRRLQRGAAARQRVLVGGALALQPSGRLRVRLREQLLPRVRAAVGAGRMHAPARCAAPCYAMATHAANSRGLAVAFYRAHSRPALEAVQWP